MIRRMALTLMVIAALALPAAAEFFCKRYDFVQERWIQLNEKAGVVTVQDIQFQFPGFVGPKKLEIPGRNQAVIHVKNYGQETLRLSLGIALFDADGNLVGCGTTGSRLGATKPGEEEAFFVPFNYLKERLTLAKTFQITLESQKVPEKEKATPAETPAEAPEGK